MLRVRDRKTGVERTVTHTAYAAMGPKVYEKLGPAPDENDRPAVAATAQSPIHRSVSAPVIRPQIKEAEQQAPEPEAETEEQEPAVEALPVKVKGKPGRKPKAISSDADATEK